MYPEPLAGEGPSFAPGQLLGERYRIESLLGRGGMGEVWRAYDLKLRLEVALKSLHPKLFDTEEGLELLRDEVRAAREVTSPNVCRLFDLVEVDGQELVSMEYIDGVTLLEHLRFCGPLELKEANEIGSQLLAGLEAIHQAGLVHRDIKPENVMLIRQDRNLLFPAVTCQGCLGAIARPCGLLEARFWHDQNCSPEGSRAADTIVAGTAARLWPRVRAAFPWSSSTPLKAEGAG